MSQDNNSIEKEKMAGTPFSNHTHIIKGVLKDPESTHNPASEGQLSEDMELAKLQQDNPQEKSCKLHYSQILQDLYSSDFLDQILVCFHRSL